MERGTLLKPTATLLVEDKELPGATLKLNDSLLWDFGAGVGLTPAGDRLVHKTRLEYSFGRKEKDPK